MYLYSSQRALVSDMTSPVTVVNSTNCSTAIMGSWCSERTCVVLPTTSLATVPHGLVKPKVSTQHDCRLLYPSTLLPVFAVCVQHHTRKYCHEWSSQMAISMDRRHQFFIVVCYILSGEKYRKADTGWTQTLLSHIVLIDLLLLTRHLIILLQYILRFSCLLRYYVSFLHPIICRWSIEFVSASVAWNR